MFLGTVLKTESVGVYKQPVQFKAPKWSRLRGIVLEMTRLERIICNPGRSYLDAIDAVATQIWGPVYKISSDNLTIILR